jgi:hypothetical protein
MHLEKFGCFQGLLKELSGGSLVPGRIDIFYTMSFAKVNTTPRCGRLI